jgi:hypothetical protein
MRRRSATNVPTDLHQKYIGELARTVAKFTGETTSNGFDLTGVPALIPFVVILLLAWRQQRTYKVR